MPFVRKKRGQVLIVHNNRDGGAIRQEVLHAFASTDALAATLEDWDSWTAMVQWRHPDLKWQWPEIRTRLTDELERWEQERSGAAVRRERRLATLNRELLHLLRTLSPARPADHAIIQRAKPQLALLQAAIERLTHKSTAAQQREEAQMQTDTRLMSSEAEQLFDEGMEHWWHGDWETACRHYRKALKLDPQHADAHNHLGIYALDRGRVKDAEQHFEAAVEGGTRTLEREGELVVWGRIENRPYLRGLGNLALVHRRRRKWHDALEIHRRILKMNPNDNQGVRFLVGDELYQLGRLDDAIAAYHNALEDPGCNYSLALALHEKDQPEEAAHALLRAFTKNRYVPPMLLGEPWEMLDGFHGTNMAEPEWAADYVQQAQHLWHKVAGSADFLRFWWHTAPVKVWREELDQIVLNLKGGISPAGSDQRRALLARQDDLKSEDAISALLGRIGG